LPLLENYANVLDVELQL